MSATSPIQWILPRRQDRAAIEYTVRLLSSLVGCEARISEGSESLDHAVPIVVYGSQTSVTGPDVLRLHLDEMFWQRVSDGGAITPTGSREWRSQVYPVWSNIDRSSVSLAETFLESCPVDPIAATFFLVSRIEEWRSEARDRHGRFPADEAWSARSGLIERPIVHMYAAAIAEAAGVNDPFGQARSRWPNGKHFCVAFTHDIDRMRMHGPLWQDLRRAIGALRFPGGVASAISRFRSRMRVKWGGYRDPYETFDKILEGHRRHGFGATFFWLSTQPSVRESDYRVSDSRVVEILKMLAEQGFELGLHGSYASFDDPSRLGREKAQLETVLGRRIAATRQHYLRFRPGVSWPAQIAAGFTSDSSLGFASKMGFRAGLAVPFKPWDFDSNKPFDIWEVPLVMMDGTAREYMKIAPKQAMERSKALIGEVARVGGGVAVVWHNSSFDDVDWNGWDQVYDGWLSETSAKGGLGATMTGLVSLMEQAVGK